MIYVYNNNNNNKRTFKDTAAVSRPRLQKRCTMLSTKDIPAAEMKGKKKKLEGGERRGRRQKGGPSFLYFGRRKGGRGAW